MYPSLSLKDCTSAGRIGSSTRLASILGGKPGRPVPSPIRRPRRGDCKGAAFAQRSCAKDWMLGDPDVTIKNWDFMGFRRFF